MILRYPVLGVQGLRWDRIVTRDTIILNISLTIS
jgi:hypothetical protein